MPFFNERMTCYEDLKSPILIQKIPIQEMPPIITPILFDLRRLENLDSRINNDLRFCKREKEELKEEGKWIKKLKCVQFNDLNINEKFNCIICYEEILKNEFVIYLKCNHFYHKSCISKWLNIDSRCPYCKRESI